MSDTLAGLVRRLRLRAGLTQEELAERSGISVRTIRGLETGRRSNPRLVSVRQLAAVLATGSREHDELMSAALDRAEPAGPPPGSPTESRVAQLPMDAADFTGRAAELTRLLASGRSASEHGAGTAVGICVIVGMGGVGKTRLAIRAAHELVREGHFEHVQLWSDLHGFHPEQPPTDPAVVLERFLRALGVQAHEIPDGVEERAALYRARLHGRRVLVLLDDAASEQQVRPLMPGGRGSLVLVTSRRSLTGLDGVTSVPLEAFTTGEALALLRREAGDRVGAEPGAARQLADLCGHLPLALALAARHLRNRPSWRLADLAGRLAAEDRRLAQLSRHDRAVRQTFDLSYRSLTEPDRRLFRLLALHPGDDFAAPSVAALAGVDPVVAEGSLELLLDEHLLQQRDHDRYRLHDLIRLYALEQTRHGEADDARLAAFVRLVEYYVGCAEHATLALYPTEVRRLAPEPERLTRAAGPFTGPPAAIAWVEREFANLLDTAERAAASTEDCARLAVRLVHALYRPLANRGHSSDRIALNRLAVRTARRIGDEAGEAQALEDLGTLCGQVGLADEAVDHSRRALALWTGLGNPAGQQGCLADIGNVLRQQGRFDEAADHLDRSLTIAQRHGNLAGEASVLNYLGLVHQRTGRLESAAASLKRSHEAYHELGNRLGEAISLANLGWAQQRGGNARDALGHHRQALVIFRALGDRYNEAEQLWGLGEAHHALAEHTEARTNWTGAIAILQDIGLLDSAEANVLRHQARPDPPEIIRLNT